MSLRIKPVITQACYIIGCSKKLKNVLETRWIWNVPLFINTFFFFFCSNTCSFPKYSVVKKNNYHAEAKSEEDKSPCCWGGGGLCLHFGLGSPHPPTPRSTWVTGRRLVPVYAGTLLLSSHGEWQWWGKEGGRVGMCGDVISSPSQLWKLILYTVFPSFLISQMTTIVISLTGTASLEDTTSPPHAHNLFVSFLFIPLLPPDAFSQSFPSCTHRWSRKRKEKKK